MSKQATMTIVQAVEAIGQNPHTLLIVNESGVIIAALPLQNIPEVNELTRLAKIYHGCAAQFFDKSEIPEEQLHHVIGRLVHGLQLNNSGKLKPGANLVHKRGGIVWAQDAARRRLLRQKKRIAP